MTETESGLGGPERDYGEEALVMIIMGGIITLDAGIEISLLQGFLEGRDSVSAGRCICLRIYMCVETGISWYILVYYSGIKERCWIK